jgi:deoxyribodipyrimidine photolyase-related protein
MRKRTQNHKPTPPLVFNNNVLEVLEEIDKTDIKTIGNIDAVNFVWPIENSLYNY